MNNISIEKGGNDPAKQQEQEAPVTNITHGTGEVVSESNMKSNSTDGKLEIHQSMPKNDLGEFLSRLTPLLSIPILSTDGVLDVVTSFDPWTLFLANAAVQEKTKNFTYIRGTIEVIFVCAVPGNCYGGLAVSALPGGHLPSDGVFPSVSDDLVPANCCQVDHWATLDFAASENLILQLPFLWPYDYALLPGGPIASWTISVTSLVPIQTAIPGGVAAGEMKVYARILEDLELVVPRFQGKRAGHLTPTHTMKQHAPATHSKVSSKLAKAGAIADKLGGVPVIGQYAEAASKVAKGAAKVASWFGFTREEAESTPIPIVNRSVSNVAHIDGDDASDVAALTIGNQISISPTICADSPDDCLSTASLFARWTAVATFTWSSLLTTNTVLLSIPVTPNLIAGDAEGFVMTTAGWFGFPFKYWRGGMEYWVYLPVSKLHRGSVQVAWIPTGSVASGDIANITMNAIIDVSAGSDHEFTVGYARDKPVLENQMMRVDTIQNYDYSNGRFVIRVVNPLQSQNDSSEVTGIVFARAAPDMEFGVPRSDWIFPGDVSPAYWSNYVSLQYQGATGDDDSGDNDKHVLVPQADPYPLDTILFGERILSVRSLLQKPHPLSGIDGGTSRAYYPFMGRISRLADQVSFNFAEYYKVPFVGFATSERYKVFTPSNVKCIFTAYECGNAAAVPVAPWYGAGVASYSGPNQGMEALMPYYANRKFFSPRFVWPSSTTTHYPNSVRCTNINVGDTTLTSGREFYFSFGPDIRCAGFRQIPLMDASY